MRGGVSADVEAMAERFNTRCVRLEGPLALEGRTFRSSQLANATERQRFCDEQV